MLFAQLVDVAQKLIPGAVVVAMILWGVLRPQPGIARDFRAGMEEGKAAREKHPVISSVVVAALLLAVGASFVLYKLR